MIKWLKEKINNTTDAYVGNYIEKRLIKATKNAEKKTKLYEESEETQKEVIGSRSCYRQYFRLFGKGNTNASGVQYSEESKILAKDILDANFNIEKINKNLSIAIKECTKMCENIQKKDPAGSKNTIIEIYLRAINILKDKKLLSDIQKYNADIPKEYMFNTKKSQTSLNDKKIIYQSCFLVLNYVNIIYLVLHMTCTFAMVSAHFICNGESNITVEKMQKFFINRFKYLFFKGVINSIDLIVYFEKTYNSQMKSYINTKIDESKTIEHWENEEKFMYSLEITPLATSAIQTGATITAGILSKFVPVLLGIVGALVLINILPIIRALIYYWGTTKVKISNFFKDESIFFMYNADALENSLANVKTEKEKIKIQKTIDKQRAIAEKLEKLSYKFSIEYEVAGEDANAVAEADERYEEAEEREEDIPMIIL